MRLWLILNIGIRFPFILSRHIEETRPDSYVTWTNLNYSRLNLNYRYVVTSNEGSINSRGVKKSHYNAYQ